MAVTITANGINYGTAGPSTAGTITGFSGGVYYAVWNDYVDMVPVNEDAVIEPGYAYAFDGKKYIKTREYGDSQFFGLDSDTYGHGIGYREGEKLLRVPVSGFALTYIDKEYEAGTPLTCTEGGLLTKASDELLEKRPYMVIATYWKKEEKEEITDGIRTVKVNGRHWVRVR